MVKLNNRLIHDNLLPFSEESPEGNYFYVIVKVLSYAIPNFGLKFGGIGEIMSGL